MSTIITESGDTIMLETISGISNASTLNDISVQTIHKEHFNTDPEAGGWIKGTEWTWDSVNYNMKST